MLRALEERLDVVTFHDAKLFATSLLVLGVLALASTPALAQLKTPDCYHPATDAERECCSQPTATRCEPVGLAVPDLKTDVARIPPLDQVDPLTPWGMRLGMPFGEIVSTWQEKTLRLKRCGRAVSYKSGDVQIEVVARLFTADGSPADECADALVVRGMNFIQRDYRADVVARMPEPADVAAAWIERFGEPARDCRKPVRQGQSATVVRCDFMNVQPDIGRLALEYSKDSYGGEVSLTAGREKPKPRAEAPAESERSGDPLRRPPLQ